MNTKCKASVLCLTYNHDQYIKDALDSFLMQKTNFKFEILIYDDASTDKTTEIILEYQRRYPKIIRVFPQKENQYSQQVYGMFSKFLLPKAKGQYIALCEGDDFWTDENKLQIAIDTLDKNKDCVMFVHNTILRNEISGQDELMINSDHFRNKTKFSLNDSLYTHVSARVFRNMKNIPPGDIFQYYFLLSKGPAYYYDKPMSVYRYTQKGIWSSLSNKKQFRKNLKMYYLVNVFLKYRYNDYFTRQMPLDFADYAKIFGRNLSWIFYLACKGYDASDIFNYETDFITFSIKETIMWTVFGRLPKALFADNVCRLVRFAKTVNTTLKRIS